MQSTNDNISFLSSLKLISSANIISSNKNSVIFNVNLISKNFSNSNCFKQHYQNICSFSFDTLDYTIISSSKVPEPQKNSIKSKSPNGLYEFYGYSSELKGKTKYHIEVSTREGFVLFQETVDHGPFCCDVFYFGKIDWDEDSMQLLYQAENVQHNAEDEFEFKQSFGENYSNIFSPEMFLLNFSNNSLRGLSLIKGDKAVYPSNPSFFGTYILYVGLEKLNFKYGISYCYNRPSSLYKYSFETCQSEKILSHYFDSFSVRSLRYEREKNCMRFLLSSYGGSHFSSCDIYELYEGFDVKKISSHNWIEKLEMNPLIYSYWSNSRKLIYWEGREDLCSILHSKYPMDSFKVLDSMNNTLLIESSNPSETPKVILLDENTFKKSLSFNIPLSNISSSTVIIKLRMNSECTLIKNSSTLIRGLVMIPHGGPNSNITTEYKTMVSLFILEGYAVVTVNYVGSLGFKREAINDLEKELGDSECNDMLLAIEKCKEFINDLKDIYICGGSHGGYIGAMMSCKYGSLFKGIILRNPVIDMAGMSMASDICDWPLGQNGGGTNGSVFDIRKTQPVDEDNMIKINRQSPSFHLKNATFVPRTLILLGDLDLRVPPFQGKMWNSWLLSRGFDSSLYVFPDTGHSLDSVTSEKKSLQLMMEFLK